MKPDSALIHKTLKEFFGYDAFKADQEKIIHHLIEGGDAFVLMPTGGGKSLCYQLPALVMEGTAIIISPLIALMKNQVDLIRGFEAGASSVAHFLNSSLSRQQIDEVREDLLAGKTKLLYVAPESLTKEENVSLLREVKISFYAVDEAHCISEWGHDFRPEYRRIRSLVDQIGRAPIIALTATATPKVQSDILKNLGIPDAAVFKSSFNRPNLYYEIRDKVDPEKDLIKFIRQNAGKSGIIYCLSRKKVEETAWASTSRTSASSSTTTSPRASRVTTRRRAAPAGTARKASASPTTATRTSRSWRSSCRASPSPSRRSAASCSPRCWLTRSRASAAANCCSTISARTSGRTTATAATTACIPGRPLTAARRCCS